MLRGTIYETAVVLGYDRERCFAAASASTRCWGTDRGPRGGSGAHHRGIGDRHFLIEDSYFEPTDSLVEPGTTLMWVNHGQEQHTVTADDGQFDSGVLNPGDPFLTTVEGSGTLTYHCTLHPEMTGSITVALSASEEVPTA